MTQVSRPLSIGLIVATLLLGACSSSGSASGEKSAPSSNGRPTSTRPTARTHAYGVGRKDITLVDHSRTTDADEKNDVPEKDSRTLPVMILYPTATKSDQGKSTDHPVADGRFPLLIFSHGVTASGPAYADLLTAISKAGFIVAAPTFPLTNGPNGWGNVGQYRNQPADVSFIITELLAADKKPKGLLSSHLAPGQIATGGHSLGGITTLGFYNTCCGDKRIKATVAISAILLPFGASPSDAAHATTPLLMIHGETDATVGYKTGSERTFDTFTKVPRALITYPKGGHVDSVFAPPYNALTASSIIAFLDMELRGDDVAWRGLSKKLAASKVASIKVAGGLASPS